MKITPEGFAVLEHDTHLSRWVEEHKRLDCDPNIERICTLFQPGQTVVDVGAALGDHTIAYARRVGPLGHVLAFESNPLQLECLRHNMQPFPRVEIIPVALGAAPARARYNHEPNVSASHLTICPDGDVFIHTLDAVVSGPVHFIKLDVEGYEFATLWGAQDTIRKHRPRMLIEITRQTRTGARPEDIYGFLKGYNYTWSPFIGSASDKQHDILAEPL